MDIFEKCDGFVLARLAQASGLYPYFLPLKNSEGTEAIIDGHRVLMLGSNNYLGLTTDPRVRQAAIKAIETFGTSCTGSRLQNGTLELHLELEQRLANFVGKEAALVFSTGYQVNLGVISCLVGRGDSIITDKEDHASIIDGAMLALGELRRFAHNDIEHLERVLQSTEKDHAALVVVDGLYSVGGDLAPLPEMLPVCQKYNARFMVDDAHGLGVMARGRGTSAHFGVTDQVDLIMGTFSKSFASLGGFVAGDENIIHYIQHHARSLIFSAAMPASNVAAALAALDIMEKEPERVDRLWEITERMRNGLQSLGFDTGKSISPIIPVIIGEMEPALEAWKKLFDAGVYTNVFVPPGVPEGHCLLRTSYMATQTDEQIDRALNIFSDVGKELGLID
ncbi:MAG: pyridoxal phosphate-dependent aminotransferase family protein [Anaerolineales bacterium]|nr:MAG: pyridoxal phosphate-dependent aminotransferase family protein [Anaerolineales bacterium]